mmetsp:Transcript_56888/g.101530  ORF Transcript_56888/g.101530 Transcript_56888/m.101530 type:complete len:88 (-) Transcript_56888:1510-1773(-)
MKLLLMNMDHLRLGSCLPSHDMNPFLFCNISRCTPRHSALLLLICSWEESEMFHGCPACSQQPQEYTPASSFFWILSAQFGFGFCPI